MICKFKKGITQNTTAGAAGAAGAAAMAPIVILPKKASLMNEQADILEI